MYPKSKPSFNIKVRKRPKVVAVVAMQSDRGIGVNGEMGWHVPEDLKHFKELTLGSAVIMGRRTYESLPNGSLPDRLNIVLTSQELTSESGNVVFVRNMQRALELAEQYNQLNQLDRVFVIGGGEIYRNYLTMFDEIILTTIEGELIEADTFFPELDEDVWSVYHTKLPFQTTPTFRIDYYTKSKN